MQVCERQRMPCKHLQSYLGEHSAKSPPQCQGACQLIHPHEWEYVVPHVHYNYDACKQASKQCGAYPL